MPELELDSPPLTARKLASPTILVVDDERLVRWSVRQRLEREGYQVLEAGSGADALSQLEGVDLVLLDYALPDTNGLEMLEKILAEDPEVLVIMITAHSTVSMAVDAMRRGAYYYTSKPFDLDEVAILVEKALDTTRMRRELRVLRAGNAVGDPLTSIVGASPTMQRVKALLTRVAHSPASTVLITGESGTGKDLAARAVHALSDRADGPFMNITCSALPEALLESELFGHEKGAFTDARQRKKGLLEESDGGTVFLDEIGEMTPTLQAKLLRFLEEKAFRRVGGSTDINPDVRVVAATHRDLEGDIAEGRFRRDLYYRLAVLRVHLPALRERVGDVELLVRCFVDTFGREFHKVIRHVTPSALAMLSAHNWPGNVRELRNTIERAVLLTDDEVLGVDDFHVDTPKRASAQTLVLPPGGIVFAELERELVVQALVRSRGNQTQAARLLGMTRDQIRYRIAKFEVRGAVLGNVDA